jgi:hypothetical protein
MIDEKQCFVEEKRTTGSRGNFTESFTILCYLKHNYIL